MTYHNSKEVYDLKYMKAMMDVIDLEVADVIMESECDEYCEFDCPDYVPMG